MHYKNGREAKVGDRIVAVDGHGIVTAGIVVKAIAGCDACNLLIVPFDTPTRYVTAKEALHTDDIAKATIPDSTLPPSLPATAPEPAAA